MTKTCTRCGREYDRKSHLDKLWHEEKPPHCIKPKTYELECRVCDEIVHAVTPRDNIHAACAKGEEL